MSNATRQTTALLAMATSTLLLIRPTTGTEHTLEYARDMVERALHLAPRTGCDEKTKRWIREHNKKWAHSGAEMVSWEPFTLASIALEIVEDLLSVIRDPAKREHIEPLQEALEALCGSYADEDKEEAEHYREARSMVADMYRVIGFQL